MDVAIMSMDGWYFAKSQGGGAITDQRMDRINRIFYFIYPVNPVYPCK
jgi:hypothetical protein